MDGQVAEVDVFIDVFPVTNLLILGLHVGNICVALKFVANIVAFVVAEAGSIISEFLLFEFEFVLDADLAEGIENCADSFSETGFQFVRRHI